MEDAELRALLETHHRESYGWAMACCWRNPADAESVLQTVYLKVLQGKARFDGKAMFKTWLFSVIRKTAADYRRRNVPGWLRLAKYKEGGNQVAQAESADERVYRSELQSLFQRTIAALPRRQREVLQLVFYHDLSLAEAASVMKVSTGSARTHYERGKKQLRRLIVESRLLDESRFGKEANQESVL
jgi:RNA polymerase sigma factor (sigma-70 family)